MQAPRKGMKDMLPAAAIAVFAGVFVLYAVAVALCGGSLLGLVVFWVAAGFLVFLPGLWLCGLLLPWLQSRAVKLVLALPLGAVLLVAAFQLMGWFLPSFTWALPNGLLALWWLFSRRKGLWPRQQVQVTPGGWWLLAMFSAALFLYVFCGVLPYAKPAAAGNMLYNQDLLWSVGNAAAAAFGAPVADLRAVGGVLHYHYFTDIFQGLLALFSGQSAWDVVCYYSWPMWCAALMAGVYVLGRGFGAGRYAALLAPFGVVFGHFAWGSSFSHIFVNMNGVVQNYCFFVALMLVSQQAEREAFKQKRTLLVFALVLLALLWSKSTVGLLVACAVLAATVVGALLHKKVNRWMLAAGSAGVLVFALLYLLLYRYAINNLVFQPSAEALKDAVGILVKACGPVLVLWLGSVVLSLREMRRISYTGLVINAVVPGGIVAYILFYHYSFSQSYFLLAACFCMWLCVGRVASRLLRPRALAAAASLLCAAALAFSLLENIHTLRSGVHTALRCVGLRPNIAATAEAVTPDDDRAAAFLRQNMANGQVFATNRNGKLSAADGVFHYYTAASGRQAFVEGWRYAMDYSLEYHQLRHNLEKVSDTIFACENYEEAARIARENGIDYLVVFLPFGGGAFTGGQPVFQTETVLIYAV